MGMNKCKFMNFLAVDLLCWGRFSSSLLLIKVEMTEGKTERVDAGLPAPSNTDSTSPTLPGLSADISPFLNSARPMSFRHTQASTTRLVRAMA